MTTTEAPPVAGPQVAATEATSTGGAPDPALPKSADRGYVVLRKADELRSTTVSPSNPPLDVWVYVATIEASSAEQAVRRAAEQPGTSFLNAEGPTGLVAVPARSWNPVTVAVKTETTIVVS